MPTCENNGTSSSSYRSRGILPMKTSQPGITASLLGTSSFSPRTFAGTRASDPVGCRPEATLAILLLDVVASVFRQLEQAPFTLDGRVFVVVEIHVRERAGGRSAGDVSRLIEKRNGRTGDFENHV